MRYIHIHIHMYICTDVCTYEYAQMVGLYTYAQVMTKTFSHVFKARQSCSVEARASWYIHGASMHAGSTLHRLHLQCVCVCMYICMYACMYLYIHTYSSIPPKKVQTSPYRCNINMCVCVVCMYIRMYINVCVYVMKLSEFTNMAIHLSCVYTCQGLTPKTSDYSYIYVCVHACMCTCV